MEKDHPKGRLCSNPLKKKKEKEGADFRPFYPWKYFYS